MSLKLGLKIDLRAILTGSGSFGFGSKKIGSLHLYHI